MFPPAKDDNLEYRVAWDHRADYPLIEESLATLCCSRGCFEISIINGLIEHGGTAYYQERRLGDGTD